MTPPAKQPPSHRRTFLLFTAIVWAAIGTSYALGATTASRKYGFSWLPESIDASELGWAWIIAAILAVIAVVRWRDKRLEALAFGAILVPPSIFSLTFLVAFLVGAHPLGWISAISYGAFAGFVLMAAAWPDPPARTKGANACQ